MKAGQFGYSFDDETYEGAFDTREEAVDEAEASADEYDVSTFRVGEYRDPDSPESFIDGEWVIDRILSCNDYDSEHAEDTFNCPQEVRDDLTAMLRAAFVAWMEKHDQRPKFFIVKEGSDERYEIVDGVAVKV